MGRGYIENRGYGIQNMGNKMLFRIWDKQCYTEHGKIIYRQWDIKHYTEHGE